jgi:endonuclease YncB( thermonuclease family)
MRFLLPTLASFLLVSLPLPAAADETAHATSGNEVALADGRVLHLDGIEQPFAGGAWRDRARDALQNLITGKQIAFENTATDRYGRLSAEAYALDAAGKKTWLQGEMLKAGLAFVYPPTGFEAQLDEMLALEAAARRARAGIWSDEAYADTPADKAFYKEGQFAFISGTVLDARRAKETVYIHFGENWRDTLTIAIAAHDLHKFRATGIDVLDLAGKIIRARGWVKHDIGPMIEITDPGQVEIFSPNAGSAVSR